MPPQASQLALKVMMIYFVAADGWALCSQLLRHGFHGLGGTMPGPKSRWPWRWLAWSVLLVLGFGLALARAGEPETNPAVLPELTPTNPPSALLLHEVRDIRLLSSAEAAKRLPVQLHGVITYADPGWKHYFIQDATGGIYVRDWQDDVRAGQWVELNGWTVPGKTVRALTEVVVRQLGHTNMPAPVRVTVPELRLPANDSQWVELEGVVRSLRSGPARLVLKLSTREGDLDAVVSGSGNLEPWRWLINTRVKVHGVASVTPAAHENFPGPQLRVPAITCLHVLEKAPTNAFAIDSRPIGQVSQHAPAQLDLRRVRVHGVVSLTAPGGEFFLQDASGAVRVHTAQTDEVKPGQALEVVGFPVTEGLGSRLSDAIFRYDPPAPEVAPQDSTASAVLDSAALRHELVSLEGQLLNDAGGSTLPILLMQSGSVIFQARFADGEAQTSAPRWLAGSRLRLTGVGDPLVESTNQPASLVLLLRRPADVQLIASPPWWTPREAVALAGGLATALLAILAWVALLRRTVRRQTRDIRQRLEAEAGLEKQLMQVWETSAEGMCMTDAQGQIVRVNEAYCRMIGKSRTELEGHPLTVAQAAEAGEASLVNYLRRFARREVPRAEELPLVLWDGRQVWFELSNSFFEHPPFPTLLLSQFRDVTERKRAEAEQQRLEAMNQQLQKSESLGRMAAAIAHNFNNQLQPVIMGIELAIADQSANAAPDTNLTEALQSAHKAAGISAQMLLYLGQSQTQPKPLDLAEIIRQSLPLLQATLPKDARLSANLPASGPMVLGNASQIQQILSNLLTNAWESTADQPGDLRLSLKQISANHIPDTNRFPVDWQPRALDYACLEVADSGCGIMASHLNKLFDPFFSTKFAGRGLGLSVVLGIVGKYGGSISVESQPGRGSVFRVFLPALAAAVSSQPVVAARAPQRLGRGNLLVF